MWQTCALLIALAAAAEPAALQPLPAEPPAAFHCRAAHLPEGRACAGRCERGAAGPADGEAAWSCLLSCSRRTLHAIADCRRAPEPRPATPLAAR